jgi:hypothetical protein
MMDNRTRTFRLNPLQQMPGLNNYVTTHRENTIDRVPLEPNSGSRRSVAGPPFTELLLGPSSGAWSRVPEEYGRVAYFTTDGGQTAPPPPDKIVRSAKVLRVEF